jgi:hypothetical protein
MPPLAAPPLLASPTDACCRRDAACRAHGRPADALAHYRQALARQPQRPEAHYGAGLALAALGRRDDATAALREAVRCRPDHAAALGNLGLALTEAGRQGPYDIALMHLACADGLPGARNIDLPRCFTTLDGWAKAVGRYTDRMMPQFYRRRAEYRSSEAYFRSLCLITALQRDLGVRYNPAKIPQDAPFGDLEDVFLHGVIQGPGGTCATLPVVYAAVGRRLGYPIKLVEAKGRGACHLFCRWEEPGGERLNLEGSGHGLSCFPDDYYREGRYALTPEEEAAGQFLKSKTPAMELAGFLAERATFCRGHGSLRHCVDAYAFASGLAPANRSLLNTFKVRLNEWNARLRAATPPGFPHLWVVAGQRRYPPAFPEEMQYAVLGNVAVERLLTHPEWDSKWWQPLRRGERPRAEPPAAALVEFEPGGDFGVTFRFTSSN